MCCLNDKKIYIVFVITCYKKQKIGLYLIKVMNMLHRRFSHRNWKKSKVNKNETTTDGRTRKINSYNIKPSSHSDSVWTSLAVSCNLLHSTVLKYLLSELFMLTCYKWHELNDEANIVFLIVFIIIVFKQNIRIWDN